MSTVMYYTEVDPETMKPVYVCKNPHEKAMQRALIQYRNPKNYELVKEALTLTGRTDLIGFDAKCLIKPRQLKAEIEKGKVFQKKSGKTQKADRSSQNAKSQKHNSKKKSTKPTIRNTHSAKATKRK